MIISDNKTIKELQKEFNNVFPYLKIEFYRVVHKENEGSPNSIKWESDKRIGLIRYNHNSGEISVNGNQKISTLESNLEKQFGLHAQVFYKSGDVWLQTISGDRNTLTEQNNKAKEFKLFQEKNQNKNDIYKY